MHLQGKETGLKFSRFFCRNVKKVNVNTAVKLPQRN